VSDAAPVMPDFDKGGGLLPVVAQDAQTGQVLMLAYMNREAFQETVATGRAVYYSRSRDHTILLKVHQVGGAACHEGYASCFFRRWTPQGVEVEGERVFDPQKVYKKG